MTRRYGKAGAVSTSIPPQGTGRSLPPSKTPMARRLSRFTKDPRYGPKLSRLPKTEQRRLLDMVAAGQGRQARKDVLVTEQARRETRNAQARQRRLTRSVDTALHNVSRQLPEARVERMKDRFAQMSWQDRKFAQTATREELRERARSGPTITINGVEINPFWYG